jgi:two-component system OmpR family response regulator
LRRIRAANRHALAQIAVTQLRPQSDPSKPPKATLLVVDDEPQNVSLMVDVFVHSGYRALGASNGAEALEIARAHKPAAILLDLIMPGMDGFAVLRQLRADAQLRHTPVMVITAMHVDEAQREFLAQHAQSVLQKGAFWIEDLLNEVERILAARGEQGQMRSAGR